MNQIMNLMLSQYAKNPMFKRAQEMASGKSQEELMQTINNICQQRGIDINSAFNTFKQVMTGGR